MNKVHRLLAVRRSGLFWQFIRFVHVLSGVFVSKGVWNFVSLEWRRRRCGIINSCVCFGCTFVLVGWFGWAREEFDSLIKIAAHLEDIKNGVGSVVFIVVGFRNFEDKPVCGWCAGKERWINDNVGGIVGGVIGGIVGRC